MFVYGLCLYFVFSVLFFFTFLSWFSFSCLLNVKVLK